MIKNINKSFRVLLILFFLLLIIIIIFFAYKKIKYGNNDSNKSAKEIEEYIFNMKSYKAKIEVTVNSNKNNNKYLLEQEYNNNGSEVQKVLKPENIEGIEIQYLNGNLILNNSKLNISKIYSEYPYLSDNILWLNSFADSCKERLDKTKLYEENNEVVIELKTNDNKYFCTRKLYLEKGTGKPIKMIIDDENKNNIVYILYKEISINK